MARSRGLIRGAGQSVRRLSSRAANAVGRPSPSVWTNRGTKQPAGKKSSVTRLMRRDPRVGKSLPLADKITDTHIDTSGGVNPTISARDKATATGTGKKRIPNRGINRSLDKR